MADIESTDLTPQGDAGSAEGVEAPSGGGEKIEGTPGYSDPYLEIETDDGPFRITKEMGTKAYQEYFKDSKKWKDSLRKKSEGLKAEREIFESEREEFNAEKENWDQIVESSRQDFARDIEAYRAEIHQNELGFMQQGYDLKQQRDALERDIERWEDRKAELKEARQSEYERAQGYHALAEAHLKEEFGEDYDSTKLQQFHQEHFPLDFYDPQKRFQMGAEGWVQALRYHQWALMGSQLEERIAEARAEVIRSGKNKRGIPRGGSAAPVPEEIDNSWEGGKKRALQFIRGG